MPECSRLDCSCRIERLSIACFSFLPSVLDIVNPIKVLFGRETSFPTTNPSSSCVI